MFVDLCLWFVNKVKLYDVNRPNALLVSKSVRYSGTTGTYSRDVKIFDFWLSSDFLKSAWLTNIAIINAG